MGHNPPFAGLLSRFWVYIPNMANCMTSWNIWILDNLNLKEIRDYYDFGIYKAAKFNKDF